MSKKHYSYNVGDLVEFVHGRLGAYIKRTGIVIEQSLKYTRDDMFKIRVGEKDYWMAANQITLLSRAGKTYSK